MLIAATERLIQFKKIAVLTDLESDAERVLRYAGALARWYGSKLMLVHACPQEMYVHAPHESLLVLPATSVSPKEAAEEKLRSLTEKLNLQDLVSKTVVREASIGLLLKELDEYRPDLLLLATHGREGIRKWLVGSVAEEVFRKVQWPVMVLGPGFSQMQATLQKQFERVLYATDCSAASVTALQYAAGIAHDHEARLIALHVEHDASQGFTFDRVMALQHLDDWLQDRIDGLSLALAGVHCVVDFGKPDEKILDAVSYWQADILVVGARGLAAAAGLASHFVGGTAYEVVCSAPCPVLVVPQPH